MSGMLLCRDKEQRMVFILRAIFKIRSPARARKLHMRAENFRQQLSRAKADLFQFMESKCGLVNAAKPCHCSKKTKGLIREGKVDANPYITSRYGVRNLPTLLFFKHGKLVDKIVGAVGKKTMSEKLNGLL